MDSSKLPISRVDELLTKLEEINNNITSLSNRISVLESHKHIPMEMIGIEFGQMAGLNKEVS